MDNKKNKDNVSNKNTIIKGRVELYKDFTINLLYYIDYYYLDRITLSDDKDIYNHYVFCFNKTCDDFLKENINFKNNKELIQYFYNYYYSSYYKSSENVNIKKLDKFWREIFSINANKFSNVNELKVLVEIYKLFDKSLNKEKNVLEFV